MHFNPKNKHLSLFGHESDYISEKFFFETLYFAKLLADPNNIGRCNG